MATTGDTSSISPWRRRDELQASADAALNALKERGEAQIELAKKSQEDSWLTQLTSHLDSGKSLYSPELSPLVAAVAGTRHAPVLNFLAQSEQARQSQFSFGRPGEQAFASEFDSKTGQRVLKKTGLGVPAKPFADRSPTAGDFSYAEAKKQLI